MDGTCSAHGKDEKSIRYFGRRTWMVEETTQQT